MKCLTVVLAFALVVCACSDKPADPVPSSPSSEQVLAPPQTTGAPPVTGCSALLGDYQPLKSVKLDNWSARGSFAADVGNPEVISEPLDIDHDGDLEIVVVGDQLASGSYVELPRAVLLLGFHTSGDDPTNVRQATERAKALGLRSPLIKAISFSQIYNLQRIRGSLADSLPMLQHASIEVGVIAGDAIIRATVVEYGLADPATGQVSAPPPIWDMLLRMSPDWTTEALCADPIPFTHN